MARRILWASLAFTPVVVAARFVFDANATTLFVLAALALLPLAWLIGEATEHAAEHTGPGVGGFLNASFGNAPELIISLFAVADNLPNVVRGSMAGSVVSNVLLVLGVAMIFGGEGRIDARSLRWQIVAIAGAVALLLVPSVPRWAGDPSEDVLLFLSVPVAVALLVTYVVITVRNLRIHREAERGEPRHEAWSLRKSIAWLAVATIATALVSEILVHSLEDFGHAVGLDQFFIAAVIVAIVGNAAEHGGAVVIAHRGNTELATEIAVTSGMQVAVFVVPAVALISLVMSHHLTLAFRPIELGTMALAAGLAWLVTRDGRSQRWEGFLLAGVYLVVVVAYFLS